MAIDSLRRTALRKRNLAWVVALAGIAMIAAGWSGDDGNWESVFIEVGAALALVVVILAVEDAWRAEIDDRIDQVRRDVAEVRAAGSGVVAEAQRLYREQRGSADHDLIDHWVSEPGPSALWAIAERCDALGCSRPAQILVGNAVVHVTPESDSQMQLQVVPQSSKVSTGRKRRVWKADDELVEVVGWIETAMASLGVHPGDELDIEVVVRGLGDVYRERIVARFTGDSA